MPLRRAISIAVDAVNGVSRMLGIAARVPEPTPDDLLAEVELEEVPESVRRARSVLGQGLYCLGAGGREPKALHPFGMCAKPKDPKHRRHAGKKLCADCSGFADWCLGWTRNDPVYGWRYCDSIFADAKKPVPGDLGHEVPIADVEPGDLVVYRSQDTDGDGDRDLIGHIGIVSAVPVAPATWWNIRVIHCSSRGGAAVKETDGAIWSKRGVVFRVRR